MSVARERKQENIKLLKGLVDTYSNFFVLKLNNLNAAQSEDIRTKLFHNGDRMLLSKNCVTKIALKEIVNDPSWFKGRTFVVMSNDFIKTSKTLDEFKKDDLIDYCFCFDKNITKMYSAEDIMKFVKIPSLDELRVMIIRTLNSPLIRFVKVLAKRSEMMSN